MMPNSTGQRSISFQQRSNRPPLTSEECSYLLELLPKILKVGTEFETNLPEAGAALEVKSGIRCVHSVSPRNCVEDCTNVESCLVERHPTFCKTRSSGQFLGEKTTCPAGNADDIDACRACDKWLLDCRKQKCASYTPFCSVCPNFSVAGASVVDADIRQDAESIRQEVKKLLRPTEHVGIVGKSGALSVIKDGSLLGGGIEVPTVGRRVHWQSFYKMCEGILEPIIKRGGFVDERTGQHFHVLSGYFDKGTTHAINDLEVPLPEIVLANLHQLHRRYEAAMFWMMSCGNRMEHLTRWSRFRQSIYQYSALRSRMSTVQQELAEKIVCMGGTNQNGKYASVAYHFCRFDVAGDVSTLHFENRIADGCLSPAVITAWAMMCYALVLKAVRLSQYGIMEVGDSEYNAAAKEASSHLIDGERRSWDGSRHADTSGIGPSIPFLQRSSRELIQLLKPEIHNLGPAFHILMELAEKPCSIRLANGDSWDEIESELYGPYKHEESPFTGNNVDEVRELIDLATIIECEDVNAWIGEVAGHLGQETEVTEETVQSLLASGRYRWSPAIGSLITV